MSDKLSQCSDGSVTRIGAPISNAGLGEAHPKGRFDVSRKPAGNGMDSIHASVGRILSKCTSVEEAVQSGVTKEFAEIHFGTKGQVSSALSENDRPTIEL